MISDEHDMPRVLSSLTNTGTRGLSSLFWGEECHFVTCLVRGCLPSSGRVPDTNQRSEDHANMVRIAGSGVISRCTNSN